MSHPEYDAEWVAAGYPERMASAMACKPPSEEVRRVYNLMPAEFAISNIALGRMKVSRFADVNDPFELVGLNLKYSSHRENIEHLKAANHNEFGVLCFSSNWAEPVMWSHYASNHRGICLGFDVPRNLLNKVEYAQDRFTVDEPLGSDPRAWPEPIIERLRTFKSKGWEYEREWRQFIPLVSATKEGSLYFVPFCPDLKLAEVILGAECTVSLDPVRALVKEKHPNAITYKARLAYQSFHVVPEMNSVRAASRSA